MWILVTLFAAACQSMRTAYQNSLAKEQGFLHATMARSLYGLPLVTVYLAVCYGVFGGIAFDNLALFLAAATVCAIAQVMATYLMLRVFQSGSFALGTLLAKTEAVLAAVLGLFVLHYPLSHWGWLGVFVGVLGALVMSLKRETLGQLHKDSSLWAGLGSGLCFAVTSVAAAMASHALEGSVMTRAALTLWYVLALQSVILCSLQALKQKDAFASFRGNKKLSWQVGVLSSLGSIGWFTGFALVNPALVKTLGQIEILGTLYFSKRRFGEAIKPQQWWGGAMIVASVLLVTFGH